MDIDLKSQTACCSELNLFFLFILCVQQGLLVVAYRFMKMAVTDDPIYVSCNVTASDIANDRSAVCTSQPGRVSAQPIVVFDHCLDSAVFRDVDAHFGERLSRIPQEVQVLVGIALPKVKMKRFIPDDRGASR
jgi:hypothetical protein